MLPNKGCGLGLGKQLLNSNWCQKRPMERLEMEMNGNWECMLCFSQTANGTRMAAFNPCDC